MKSVIFELSGKDISGELVKENPETVLVRVSCKKELSGQKVIKRHRRRHSVVM